MKINLALMEKIRAAARGTPAPARAEANLTRLFEATAAEEDAERLTCGMAAVATLFASSQFLANHSIARPGDLAGAIGELGKPMSRESLFEEAATLFPADEDTPAEEATRRLRLFRRRRLLPMTMRYLKGETDIATSMEELTALAEAVVEAALGLSVSMSERRYGPLSGGAKVAVIGLGKMGGMELNYSSDIDLMVVYRGRGGSTAGRPTPAGGRAERLSAHEFYQKVAETMVRLLSTNTPEGIAYRVDMRLRPQGQRGELALGLGAYRGYYQQWGRTWERMVLIRARPVAGDRRLGEAFVEAVEPFVWGRPIDQAELEEIKAMKKRIDSPFLGDDIKRGYGGIREAEFFVQCFQLLYGPEHGSLRTYRILNALQGLRWLGLVPEKDVASLWENYLFLRHVEHHLQMMDDRQAYVPPTSPEAQTLARAMGAETAEEFFSELRARRMAVRGMYNSLLGTEEDAYAETLGLLEGEAGDGELRGYLSLKVRFPDDALRSLKRVREAMSMPGPPYERTLLRRALPQLLDHALNSESPDRALAGIEGLFESLGLSEARLAAFTDRKELVAGIIKLFALAPGLTRAFLSGPYYLDRLIEEMMPIRKTLKRMEEGLSQLSAGGEDFSVVLARFRQSEEIRLAMFFLMKVLGVEDLLRYISYVAEAAVCAATTRAGGSEGFLAVAMGKLGARETAFGSDLDLVFVSGREDGAAIAESVIKFLASYTAAGQPYAVDARLRPDGTKGTLTKDIEGLRTYYMDAARNWEVQALLRARPVAGDALLARAFMSLVRGILLKRGRLVRRRDIEEMRGRIMRERARETGGIDLKLGPGGIEDIEFHVQRLQLRAACRRPEVLVQGTLPALRRLVNSGVIGRKKGTTLADIYRYYRTLDAILRLNGADVLDEGGEAAGLAAAFMGRRNAAELTAEVRQTREKVLAMTEKG